MTGSSVSARNIRGMFGEGISMVGDILDLAASCDVVAKSGAWYAYEGNKIGQEMCIRDSHRADIPLHN